MSMEMTFIYVATFVCVTVTVAAVISWFGQDSRVNERMTKLQTRRTERSIDVLPEEPSNWFRRIVKRVVHLFSPASRSQELNVRKRCLHAGLYGPSAVHLFLMTQFLLVVLAAVVTLVLLATQRRHLDLILLGGAMVCAICVLLPGFWLDCKKKKRQAVLTKTLPDFLDILVTCLEGGLSLEGGLKRVSVELKYAHPILASELLRLQQEIDFGATPEAATMSFAERTDLDILKTLASFLQQSRKFGSSITDALRSHSEMLREKREMRAEELAQKAAVKILFPTLVLIFPAVFTVLAGPAAIQLAEKFGK